MRKLQAEGLLIEMHFESQRVGFKPALGLIKRYVLAPESESSAALRDFSLGLYLF